MAPEQKDIKNITISLPSAVAKENNRSSIISAQNPDRMTKSNAKPSWKPGRKPGPKSSSKVP